MNGNPYKSAYDASLQVLFDLCKKVTQRLGIGMSKGTRHLPIFDEQQTDGAVFGNFLSWETENAGLRVWFNAQPLQQLPSGKQFGSVEVKRLRGTSYMTSPVWWTEIGPNAALVNWYEGAVGNYTASRPVDGDVVEEWLTKREPQPAF